MTARFHSQAYRNSSRRKLTIESLSVFAMLQTPFLKLSTFCIHTRYLLKLGMVIHSYNDHCSAPFSRACWLVSTTNFIRELEPTLSWNQYHSSAFGRDFERERLLRERLRRNRRASATQKGAAQRPGRMSRPRYHLATLQRGLGKLLVFRI